MMPHGYGTEREHKFVQDLRAVQALEAIKGTTGDKRQHADSCDHCVGSN
jgi:hypothetical protein